MIASPILLTIYEHCFSESIRALCCRKISVIIVKLGNQNTFSITTQCEIKQNNQWL